MNDARERVVATISRVLKLSDAEIANLRLDAGYKSIARWTSARHAEIIVALEDEFGVEIEGIRAVEVGVVVLCRREVGGVLVVDIAPFRAEGIERVGEIGGGPQYAGVGDQREAQGLVDLVVEVPPSNLTLMGEEQVAAQRVQALALVQLAPCPATELFVGDVAAEVDRADQTAVFVQRPGQAGLPTAGVQLGDEQAGGGVPEFHRADEAEHVVPVLGDELGLDRLAEQRSGVRVAGAPGRCCAEAVEL